MDSSREHDLLKLQQALLIIPATGDQGILRFFVSESKGIPLDEPFQIPADLRAVVQRDSSKLVLADPAKEILELQHDVRLSRDVPLSALPATARQRFEFQLSVSPHHLGSEGISIQCVGSFDRMLNPVAEHRQFAPPHSVQ